MKEYRVKKGLRILMYVLASLVIFIYGGFLIALIIPPFNKTIKEMQDSMPGLWLPALFLVMIVLMIVSIISIKKRKVIITEESIISITLFGKKELKFIEIKCFNIFKNPKIPMEHIGIAPLDSTKKNITLSNLFENSEELKSVLRSKIVDLNAEELKAMLEKREKEHKEILTNNDFGFTIEEREDKLKKARLFAKVVNSITSIVCVWLFFYPKPYHYAIITCISLPIIGILSVKFWKGLIKIDSEKESAYPMVAFPIVFPGVILTLRVMLDFSIDDYSNIWIPAILIALVYAAIVISCSKQMSFNNAKGYFSILSYVVFGFIYGYSAVVALNCTFDESEPLLFDSHVISKEINGGRKTKSYDLKISPWGNKTEIEKVSVDRELYENVEAGNSVLVYQFKGRFDIPWVVVGYGR
ncbi:hypothetical protein [Flavobacterium tistrianum]|uniref:hypothetical protein n=1 Tax=Flavobacterium tistrianum TaxID=1685414 RepID=UPI0013A61882|nr:hypothetical protein [Flavobacterium tistrianum]KAF2339222.1 hypothetical protein DMB71_17190 [Flavobacterium tistrianum]